MKQVKKYLNTFANMKKIKILEQIKPKSKSVDLQLAARAVLLFLDRLLLEKLANDYETKSDDFKVTSLKTFELTIE